MEDTQKPFSCTNADCSMTFTNEDHLHVHRKKHDMALHLGIEHQNGVADQTPTPTRFIRNCEEVGLFQDLQNVNPFDETFQKAVELVKTGTLHVPEVSGDDTLHTPHVFPHIEENIKFNESTRHVVAHPPEFNIQTVSTIDEDLLKLVTKDNKIKQCTPIILFSDESDVHNKKLLVDKIVNLNDAQSNGTEIIVSEIDNIKTSVSISHSVINRVSDNVIKSLNICNNSNRLSRDNDNSNVNVVHVESLVSEKDIREKLKETLKSKIKGDFDFVTVEEQHEFYVQKIDESTILVNAKPCSDYSLLKKPQKRTNKCHDENEGFVESPATCKVQKREIQEKRNLETNGYKPVDKFSRQNGTSIEHQRELNRAAQFRSRIRKKRWINEMQKEISTLKTENKNLKLNNQNLRDEVASLKAMLLYHQDCPISSCHNIVHNNISTTTNNKIIKDNGTKMIPIRPQTASKVIVSAVPTMSSISPFNGIQLTSVLPGQPANFISVHSLGTLSADSMSPNILPLLKPNTSHVMQVIPANRLLAYAPSFTSSEMNKNYKSKKKC